MWAFDVSISLQEWSHFWKIEGWIKSENEKNIDHELDIEVDQSI